MVCPICRRSKFTGYIFPVYPLAFPLIGGNVFSAYLTTAQFTDLIDPSVVYKVCTVPTRPVSAIGAWIPGVRTSRVSVLVNRRSMSPYVNRLSSTCMRPLLFFSTGWIGPEAPRTGFRPASSRMALVIYVCAPLPESSLRHVVLIGSSRDTFVSIYAPCSRCSGT